MRKNRDRSDEYERQTVRMATTTIGVAVLTQMPDRIISEPSAPSNIYKRSVLSALADVDRVADEWAQLQGWGDY